MENEYDAFCYGGDNRPFLTVLSDLLTSGFYPAGVSITYPTPRISISINMSTALPYHVNSIEFEQNKLEK
jgi:hypothetical protein